MKRVIVSALLIISVLICVVLISVNKPALAICDTQAKTLDHYESVMEGKWELEDFTLNTEYPNGLPLSFTFDKTHLGITNDDRVFYQWNDQKLQVNGGEVLLCNWMTNKRTRIGFVFTVNGCTTIAYYLKVIK